MDQVQISKSGRRYIDVDIGSTDVDSEGSVILHAFSLDLLEGETVEQLAEQLVVDGIDPTSVTDKKNGLTLGFEKKSDMEKFCENLPESISKRVKLHNQPSELLVIGPTRVLINDKLLVSLVKNLLMQHKVKLLAFQALMSQRIPKSRSLKYNVIVSSDDWEHHGASVPEIWDLGRFGDKIAVQVANACYYCKKVGHLRDKCPVRMAKRALDEQMSKMDVEERTDNTRSLLPQISDFVDAAISQHQQQSLLEAAQRNGSSTMRETTQSQINAIRTAPPRQDAQTPIAPDAPKKQKSSAKHPSATIQRARDPALGAVKPPFK
ncbi:hypothetical protein MP228_000501 [Amoeboaphelidium protococcarum]|nr:hypothetical protein MP228_000501 [Amoeboaphelidium protococcarum]